MALAVKTARAMGGVPEGMLGPIHPLMPRQVRLCGSGVPHYSSLKGHLLWAFAATTPGSARNSLFYFTVFVCANLELDGAKRSHDVGAGIKREAGRRPKAGCEPAPEAGADSPHEGPGEGVQGRC